MQGAPGGPSRPCDADPIRIALRTCKPGTMVGRGATTRRADEVAMAFVPILSRR
jgi:hypothetical protein